MWFWCEHHQWQSQPERSAKQLRNSGWLKYDIKMAVHREIRQKLSWASEAPKYKVYKTQTVKRPTVRYFSKERSWLKIFKDKRGSKTKRNRKSLL